MLERLQEIVEKYNFLETRLADPEILNDQKNFQEIAKEHSGITPIVKAFKEYEEVLKQIEESKILFHDPDPEIRDIVRGELDDLQEKKEELEKEIKVLLLPKDPNDEKNVLLEIRAGTGGEEAALFAGELFRMYSRYAERKRWKMEILSESPTGIGGYKEIILLISGERVFSRLKYERGIHRVQRVPETETQGRVHTSAVTVAVLPEAEEVDVYIDPKELKIDVCRASGAGGQHVNKTESAVRITHLPTGIAVYCQDERSQLKNRSRAMKVISSRILDMRKREQDEQITEERRSMVGTGDRSGKIRTYNFPQSRLTDHRIGLTLYRLESIMDGDIDEIIDTLVAYFQAEAISKTAESIAH
jgi:peptide chain release factor 1